MFGAKDMLNVEDIKNEMYVNYVDVEFKDENETVM